LKSPGKVKAKPMRRMDGKTSEESEPAGVLCPEDKPIVKVERKGRLPAITGAFVQSLDAWVIIQNIDDFEIDGYSILPDACVKRLRYGKGEVFHESLCKGIGLLSRIKPLTKKHLDDIDPILERSKKGTPIIIECESKGTWPFSIGYFVKRDKSRIWLDYFDSLGDFEKKPRVIKVADITRIGVDERYAKVYGSYLGKKKRVKR
jgi:hypothetical protein